MRLHPFFFVLIMLSLFGCKKENADPSSAPAAYTLVADRGICSNVLVEGMYEAGTALNASNKVTLQVNVTSIGTYAVASSSSYGLRFADSGTFVRTGTQNIVLKGTGNPTAAGVFAFLFTAGSSSCRFNISIASPPPPIPTDNDHLLFGNPSNAAFNVDSANNYLMRKPYYNLSYSRDRGIPNWVSWHLYAADIGSISRQDNFLPDESLPSGWYQVFDYAYTGSGFDRGHNIPSGDRTNTVDANLSTFLMTNMIPQAPNHNQGIWANLEDSLRRLAGTGLELYIVMGSYGNGGTGNNGFATSIDGGKVAVPANIWKIALAIPNGNNDTTRVTTSTRTIAVNIPNNNNISGNWKNYRVSVDAIEAATGYDFLQRLPASLQAVLEARVDNY
jgi:DNA/RNA endonuclease G (NUC1)